MDCKDVKQKLSFYIDETLEENEMAELNGHLTCCDVCRAEYETLAECVTLLRDIGEVKIPAEFDARLRASISEINKSGKASGSHDKRKIWRMVSGIAAIFVIGFFSFAMYNHMGDIASDDFYDQSGLLYEDGSNLETAREGAGDESMNRGQEEKEAEKPGEASKRQAASVFDTAKALTAQAGTDQAPDDAAEAEQAISGQAETETGTEMKRAGEASDAMTAKPQASSEPGAGDDSVMSDAASRHLYSGGTENAKKVEDFVDEDTLQNPRDLISVTYYVKRLEDELSDFEFIIKDCWKESDGAWCFKVQLDTVNEYGQGIVEELIYAGQDGKVWKKELLSLTEIAY